MRGLYRLSIRRPVLVLVAGLLATLAFAPGIARLRLRTDGHALVPQDAPEIRVDREVRRAFGVRDPLVVLVRPRHVDGIFNSRTLQLVVDLTAALTRVPGLDSADVRSLATESADRLIPGTLRRATLLRTIPHTPGAMDTLRSDIRAIGLLTGTLVSGDGRATAITAGVPADADRVALVAAVTRAVSTADTAGHAIDVIGAPAAEALLGSHILDDLGVGWKSPVRELDRTRAGAGGLADLRDAIAAHLGLLPLSILIMAVVFLVCFRNLTATALPLVQAGASLVFVLGLMGWTGVPVYLTMAVLPVILVCIGLADEIHVFTCYSRLRAAQPGAPVAETVKAALDGMALPVIATSVTTAAGFLSFALSPLPPVRAFGWFTAAGIVFCLLWTLTVIPASLVLFAPRGFHAPGVAARAASRGGGWRWFAGWIGRGRAVVLALAALALALTPFGIRRLAVQDSWIGGFAPESRFRRATEDFNGRFFGTHMLLLAVDTGHLSVSGELVPDDMGQAELRLPEDLVPDPEALTGCVIQLTRPAAAAGAVAFYRPSTWKSVVERAERRDGRIVVHTPPYHGSPRFLMMPAAGETLRFSIDARRLALPRVLGDLDALESFIRSRQGYTVGGAIGPSDYIKTAEHLTSDRAPGSRVIPRNPDRVRWLWDVLGTVQGERRMHEIVNPGLERGLIRVFLKDANFVDTERLMGVLRDFERTELEPAHIRFDFAGDVAVSQTLIRAIVHSQVRSLLVAVLGILVLTALLFRSLRWGLVSVLPVGLAVAATFAVMGWTGMPLGVATSMFAGMVLGIGVDFAIHLVSGYRRAAAGEPDRGVAVAEALAATGPAIAINGLAVGLGFGVLVLSRVPANAQLGAIAVVSLAACLAATLVVVPALLQAGRRRG